MDRGQGEECGKKREGKKLRDWSVVEKNEWMT